MTTCVNRSDQHGTEGPRHRELTSTRRDLPNTTKLPDSVNTTSSGTQYEGGVDFAVILVVCKYLLSETLSPIECTRRPLRVGGGDTHNTWRLMI